MANTPNAGGVNLAGTVPASTFEQDGKGFALGDSAVAGGGGGKWYFCKAATDLAIGQVVGIDSAWLATKLTSAIALTMSRVGVVPVAVTSGDYFWAQNSGVIAALQVTASSAANVPLYTTATAGQLSDSASGQVLVEGVKLTAARGGTDGVAAALGVKGEINTGGDTGLGGASFSSISSGNGTMAAGAMEGAGFVTLATSGATALTTRTAAQIFAGVPFAAVGTSWIFRVYNTNGGTLTLTGGTGVTITGTATIATNVTRDYCVTINSATTLTMQNIGAGAAT